MKISEKDWERRTEYREQYETALLLEDFIATLSKQQKKIAFLLSKRCTTAEICDILDLKAKTVRNYIKRIQFKISKFKKEHFL